MGRVGDDDVLCLARGRKQCRERNLEKYDGNEPKRPILYNGVLLLTLQARCKVCLSVTILPFF